MRSRWPARCAPRRNTPVSRHPRRRGRTPPLSRKLLIYRGNHASPLRVSRPICQIRAFRSFWPICRLRLKLHSMPPSSPRTPLMCKIPATLVPHGSASSGSAVPPGTDVVAVAGTAVAVAPGIAEGIGAGFIGGVGELLAAAAAPLASTKRQGSVGFHPVSQKLRAVHMILMTRCVRQATVPRVGAGDPSSRRR